LKILVPENRRVKFSDFRVNCRKRETSTGEEEKPWFVTSLAELWKVCWAFLWALEIEALAHLPESQPDINEPSPLLAQGILGQSLFVFSLSLPLKYIYIFSNFNHFSQIK
jgi:hypothetical protein